MLSKERQQEIISILHTNKIIKIKEISERFKVSNETARRDLEALEAQKLLKRVYGGAVPLANINAEPLYSIRAELSVLEKRAIGKKAAELIKEGSTLLFDVGTTTLEIAKNIVDRKNITVITSSLPIINELANTDIELLVLGGKLRNRELSMSGSIPLMALQQIYVDMAFVGAGGVTFEEGISDYNIEEAQVRKLAIERANACVLAVDSSKFGINAFAMVSPLNAIDIVISDWKLEEEIIREISERGIEVIIAPAPI